MPRNDFGRDVIAGGVAVFAMTLAACGDAAGDRAGGTGEAQSKVLQMAMMSDDGPSAEEDAFAQRVGELSGGELTIEFQPGSRVRETDFESGMLEDVQGSTADLALVGARAFDNHGVVSFQALLAPLLIDSIELQAAVFERGIPNEMLDGIEDLELVGLGVLPGPMRRLLGVADPLVSPADFDGKTIGIQSSRLAELTLRSLGATPRAVPFGASLDGLDGYEQQLGSIYGNRYQATAKYVTGNVNLWPRPLVMVTSKEAFDALTSEEQSILQDAMAANVADAFERIRGEEDEAVRALCTSDLMFTEATESQLSELGDAFEPVYEELNAHAPTKEVIDQIASMKAEIGAAPDAPRCASPPPVGAASIPEGTYQTTLTAEDWSSAGVPDGPVGVFTLVIEGATFTVTGPDGEVGFSGTYTVFRDEIEFTDEIDTVTAQWRWDGEVLTFSNVVSPGCTDCEPFAVVFGSHPFSQE